MALQPNQTAIELNKLYKVIFKGENQVDGEINPNIFINTGSVNIYAYNGTTQPEFLNDMVLATNSTNISGITLFNVLPTYIALTQNNGTSTEIVLTGITVIDLGTIGALT